MIHPAFLAIAQQPGLVLDHAGGYAELASAEFDEWSQQVKRRATLSAASALLLVLGLVLGGVALLALAVVPLADMPHPWLLALVPAVPLLAAAALAGCVARSQKLTPFSDLRQQLAQDLATLRILEQE